MAKKRALKKIQNTRLNSINKKKNELLRMIKKLSKNCNINLFFSFEHQNKEKTYFYNFSSNKDLNSLGEEINNEIDNPENIIYNLQDYSLLCNKNQHQDDLSTQED